MTLCGNYGRSHSLYTSQPSEGKPSHVHINAVCGEHGTARVVQCIVGTN